ncbi:hypothetical protein F444_08311, partial [Phytophthora nicotianae P1976]
MSNRSDLSNKTVDPKMVERRRRNAEAARRYRCRRTPEDRERHRQQERIRRRERRQRSTAPSTSMPALRQRSEPATVVVNELDVPSTPAWGDRDVPQLRPVSSVTQERFLERLRGALGASGLDETVCAVCDTWVLRTHCHTVVVSEFVQMNDIQTLLSSRDENLIPPLVSEYDCSSMLPELEGILLSKRGVDQAGRSLHVCNLCDDSLKKREIPKFAIKN